MTKKKLNIIYSDSKFDFRVAHGAGGYDEILIAPGLLHQNTDETFLSEMKQTIENIGIGKITLKLSTESKSKGSILKDDAEALLKNEIAFFQKFILNPTNGLPLELTVEGFVFDCDTGLYDPVSIPN